MKNNTNLSEWAVTFAIGIMIGIILLMISCELLTTFQLYLYYFVLLLIICCLLVVTIKTGSNHKRLMQKCKSFTDTEVAELICSEDYVYEFKIVILNNFILRHFNLSSLKNLQSEVGECEKKLMLTHKFIFGSLEDYYTEIKLAKFKYFKDQSIEDINKILEKQTTDLSHDQIVLNLPFFLSLLAEIYMPMDFIKTFTQFFVDKKNIPLNELLKISVRMEPVVMNDIIQFDDAKKYFKAEVMKMLNKV